MLKVIDDSCFTAIANTIRSKTGSTAGLTPADVASEIGSKLDSKAIMLDEKCYGFEILYNESNPSDAVVYRDDNADYTPARMNFTTGVFSYGDWNPSDFFFSKPCMVTDDGTVDYYLDPDDCTKKLDGSPSDVGDATYSGNAMVEFGGAKKIYISRQFTNEKQIVRIANYKVDSTFSLASNFKNEKGQELDSFQTAMYESCEVGGTLRSLSGKTVATGYTLQESNDMISNNGANWFNIMAEDVTLVLLLSILISKTLDVQSAFGKGNVSSGAKIQTGTMNTKGMFYGSNDVLVV